MINDLSNVAEPANADDADDVTEALRRTGHVGPYFATTVAEPTQPAAGTATLAELYRDSFLLRTAIDDVAVRLGSDEPRVAASTLFLGHAARVWSVVLGCWATSGVVPDLSPATVRWRAATGGRPTELIVVAPRGTRVPAVVDAAAAIGRVVVDGHLRPFVDAVTSATGVAPGLLWGNAASAMVGTVQVLGAPSPLRRVAAALLATGPLAGTTRHEVDADGPDGEGGGGALVLESVVRRSCCLYYRLPGGGWCGDCPLPVARRGVDGTRGLDGT